MCNVNDHVFNLHFYLDIQFYRGPTIPYAATIPWGDGLYAFCLRLFTLFFLYLRMGSRNEG